MAGHPWDHRRDSIQGCSAPTRIFGLRPRRGHQRAASSAAGRPRRRRSAQAHMQAAQARQAWAAHFRPSVSEACQRTGRRRVRRRLALSCDGHAGERQVHRRVRARQAHGARRMPRGDVLRAGRRGVSPARSPCDPRAPGAGGAPDWRLKLDSQRGAVVATEMKNNSAKLSKWTVQSILAGAEQLKIGYATVCITWSTRN